MSSVPTPPRDVGVSGWRSASSWWWAAGATALVTLVYGTVYWTTPYSDLDIGSVTLAVYVAAALPVVVLRAMGVAPFLLSAAVSPAGLVGAVIVRVAVDVWADPTSHNLWPLEIVIAGVVGAFWGLVAAGLGELVLRLRR